MNEGKCASQLSYVAKSCLFHLNLILSFLQIIA